MGDSNDGRSAGRESNSAAGERKPEETKSSLTYLLTFGGFVVSFLTVAISVAQVWTSYIDLQIQREKDKIEWSFRTAEFLLENKDLCTSENEEDFEYFKCVIEASFPDFKKIVIFWAMAESAKDAERHFEMKADAERSLSSVPDERFDEVQQSIASTSGSRLQIARDANDKVTIVDSRVREKPLVYVISDPAREEAAKPIVRIIESGGFEVRTGSKMIVNREPRFIKILYYDEEDKNQAVTIYRMLSNGWKEISGGQSGLTASDVLDIPQRETLRGAKNTVGAIAVVVNL